MRPCRILATTEVRIIPGDPGAPAAAGSTLLAVDAGVRTGFALYGGDGRLRWYRSRNYGSIGRLRKAAYGLVAQEPALALIAVEGGGSTAEAWRKEADRRGVAFLQVDAGAWRQDLLLPRDRRSRGAAKERADVLARRVIEWSGAPRPTSLRHDAAEAILLGLWASVRIGWLDAPPDAVLRG